jgi:uridine kinase
LASCLKKLKSGERADIPVYDFATHTRQQHTLTAHPKKIIVVDGILIFHAAEVCSLFDERIFFETPEELRFQRRLERDVKERGRKADGVHQQFFKQVKPMHDLYVEPSKKFAETIVKDVGHFEHVLNSYLEKFQRID